MIKSRLFFAVLLAAAAVLSISGSATARPALDSSFGTNGRVFSNFGFTPIQASSRVRTFPLANGRTLAFQSFNGSGITSSAVYRVKADGSLDTTFATNGLLRADLGVNLNLLPDGKFIISGEVDGGPSGSDVGLRRYTADGKVDSGFGKKGLTRYDLGYDDRVETVTTLDGGRLLVQAVANCGSIHTCDPESPTNEFFSVVDSAGKVAKKSKPLPGLFGDPVVMPNGSVRALGRTKTDFFGDDEADEALVRINPDLTISIIRSFDRNQIPSNDLAVNADGFLFMLRGNNPSSVVKLTPAGTDEGSFGTNGATTCTTLPLQPPQDVLVGDNGPALQVDSQGRVIARSTGCDLFRLLPDGTVDSSFGTGGAVDTDAISMSAAGVKVTPDDGLILSAWDYQHATAVLKRLGPNGQFDPTFGGPNGLGIVSGAPRSDAANSLSVLKNGRLLIGGQSRCLGLPVLAQTSCPGLLMARYSTSGKLDDGYGKGEVAQQVGLEAYINAIKTGKSGSVIAAGRGVPSPAVDPRSVMPPVWFMTKYLPSGKVDTGFGDAGKVFTDPSEFGSDSSEGSYISAIDFQKDGKIIATGYARDCGGYEFCLPIVRYNPDGSLDEDFGKKGITNIAGGAVFGRSIAVQKDGKILVGASRETTDGRYPIVVRLKKNGRVDRSYGARGFARPKLVGEAVVKKGLSDRSARVVTDIELLRNGSILASGAEAYGQSEGVVMKLDGDGKLVRSFGRRGALYTGLLEPNSIARDECGRIVVVGNVVDESSFGEGDNIGFGALRRYSANGHRDNSFYSRGLYYPFGQRDHSSLASVAVGAKGQIFAAGWKDQATNGHDVALVKLKKTACR